MPNVKPATRVVIVTALLVVVSAIVFWIDKDFGTGVILTFTAVGAVSYSVLVYAQVIQGERALSEQREANSEQERRSREQIEQMKMQLKQQSAYAIEEAKRWQKAERTNARARLDAIMPILQVEPSDKGMFRIVGDAGDPEPLSSGDRFAISDPTIIRWRVRLVLRTYGEFPVNIFLPDPLGEYEPISGASHVYSNQALQPGGRLELLWQYNAGVRTWMDHLQNGYLNPNEPQPEKGNGAVTLVFSVSPIAQSLTDTYAIRLQPSALTLDQSQLKVRKIDTSWWPPTASHIRRDYRLEED